MVKKGKNMTITQIINEATQNPENINEDGSVNWDFVDSDLWLHPESEKFTDKEKREGLDNFLIRENIID
tara:strand:+ start:195 stop:401 length:207 start_codon:yes stop_codon:yes gene_type:complete